METDFIGIHPSNRESALRNGWWQQYIPVTDNGKMRHMSEDLPAADLMGLTAEIVAAHVSNNPVALADLPNLIQEVYRTLASVGLPAAKPQPDRPQPAVAIKKSITPEYLICLEDGKKLKMLKRHLQTSYNMTPEQYRERWGLTNDYPMVAPNYAKHRSSLAKKIGLGTKPRGRPPRNGARREMPAVATTPTKIA